MQIKIKMNKYFKMKKNLSAIILLFSLVLILDSCRRSIPTLNGDWKRQASFIGQPRDYPVLFVIGNKAYVGTGYSYQTQTWWQDFYAYDIVADKWSRIADFPGIGRQEAVAFSVGGKGYVGLGYSGKTLEYFQDFYSYDPASDVWTKITDFPSTRRAATSFVLNNIAYVGNGQNVDTNNNLISSQSFYKLNTTTNPLSWETIAPYSGYKVNGAFSFVLNNKAYVGGGFSGGVTSKQFYTYDPTADRWAKKAYLDSNITSIPRGQTVSFVINNSAYIATGGQGSNGASNDAYRYDDLQDTWVQVNGFEGGARSGAVGFSVEGTSGYRAYIGLGGVSGSDDWWSFNPDVPQVLNN